MNPMFATKFHGPTDTRGSRVSATNINSGKRVTLPWDHALGAYENHEAAAHAALKALGHTPTGVMCSGAKGGGYVFAFSI